MTFEQRLKSDKSQPMDWLELILEPKAYLAVNEAAKSGVLPADTLLRLDTIGDQAYSPKGSNLRRDVLLDLYSNLERPDEVGIYTRHIIWEQQPRALLAWDPFSDQNRQILRSHYDQPFLTYVDLAEVIKSRRAAQGRTIIETPNDRRSMPPDLEELRQCLSVSKRLWTVLVSRVRPEWVSEESLNLYFRPRGKYTRGGKDLNFDTDGYTDRYSPRSRVVGAAALRIDLLLELYEEAKDTGIVNIAEVGMADMHMLLADQYFDPSEAA